MEKIVLERKTASSDVCLVACGYEECARSQFYGPTKRDYYIIHFVTSGKGHFYIGNQHFIIEPGNCFLNPRGVSTFYHADTIDPWTYSWICFNGIDSPKLIEHCNINLSRPIFHMRSIDEIQYLIFEMMNHYKKSPANELFIQSFLIRIFAILQEGLGSAYTNIETTNNELLEKTISFIQNSDLKRLTVSQVAQKMNISRTYLFSLFKKHLNMSTQQFITNAKISNSREFLAKTSLPIQEIAAQCGYRNPFAFSRAFKREISLTPSEYRRLYFQPNELLDDSLFN